MNATDRQPTIVTPASASSTTPGMDDVAGSARRVSGRRVIRLIPGTSDDGDAVVVAGVLGELGVAVDAGVLGAAVGATVAIDVGLATGVGVGAAANVQPAGGE